MLFFTVSGNLPDASWPCLYQLCDFGLINPTLARLGRQTLSCPVHLPSTFSLAPAHCSQWTPVTLRLRISFWLWEYAHLQIKASSRVIISAGQLQPRVSWYINMPASCPLVGLILSYILHHSSEFPSRTELQLPNWKLPWKKHFLLHSLSHSSLLCFLGSAPK